MNMKKKQLIILTESDLHNIIKESVDKVLKENESNQPDPNYTHYAVNKLSGKIVNGWDYSDIDCSELREFKRDYFFDDLIDYGLNPKDYKILTKRNVEKLGIDINNWDNWANS